MFYKKPKSEEPERSEVMVNCSRIKQVNVFQSHTGPFPHAAIHCVMEVFVVTVYSLMGLSEMRTHFTFFDTGGVNPGISNRRWYPT